MIKLIPARLRESFKEVVTPSMNTARLLSRVGRAGVAIPFGADKRLTHILQESHLYAPSFFAGLTNVFDAKAEKQSIDDLDKQRWALIPSNVYFADENIDFVRRVFSFPIRYRYLRNRIAPERGSGLTLILDGRRKI